VTDSRYWKESDYEPSFVRTSQRYASVVNSGTCCTYWISDPTASAAVHILRKGSSNYVHAGRFNR